MHYQFPNKQKKNFQPVTFNPNSTEVHMTFNYGGKIHMQMSSRSTVESPLIMVDEKLKGANGNI